MVQHCGRSTMSEPSCSTTFPKMTKRGAHGRKHARHCSLPLMVWPMSAQSHAKWNLRYFSKPSGRRNDPAFDLILDAARLKCLRERHRTREIQAASPSAECSCDRQDCVLIWGPNMWEAPIKAFEKLIESAESRRDS